MDNVTVANWYVEVSQQHSHLFIGAAVVLGVVASWLLSALRAALSAL